jgi:hypothetical protein
MYGTRMIPSLACAAKSVDAVACPLPASPEVSIISSRGAAGAETAAQPATSSPTTSLFDILIVLFLFMFMLR